MNIAMWSGPRNLSTAMMYAFGARSDTAIVDEPFYATYLASTGIDHPMRTEILESQSQDPETVIQALFEPVSPPHKHRYVKHMTHHMLPKIDLGWMARCVNVFLIRHPARVIASYDQKRDRPSVEDLGFLQQARVFEYVCDLGQKPLVIDSADVRSDPAGMLQALCKRIEIDWSDAMLSWPSGGHKRDGVWAKHWYDGVHRSTGFSGVEGPLPSVECEFRDVLDATLPVYETLHANRIRPVV